jgi:hypothetical protein
MIGIITTNGIPLPSSLKARIFGIIQERVFSAESSRGNSSLSRQDCRREGTLTLKTYADVQSLSCHAMRETPIAVERYEIDDSFFGSYEVVIVEHGFSCAGRAIHGESFDPWGPYALARLASNLLQTGGSIAVRNDGEHIEVRKAFWPAQQDLAPELPSTLPSMFSTGRWAFLKAGSI